MGPAINHPWRIGPPDLQWRDDGVPASESFDDIYFSRDGGLAETRHTFLDAIVSRQVWSLNRAPILGELGFGTGLNFLATWADWKAHAPPGCRLHYVAVEGFPLNREQMAKALQPFSELAALAAHLRAALPDTIAGPHRVCLEGGRVTLTLLYGPVETALDQMRVPCDAWYLDGFAPKRNPDMWSDGVLAHIARLSKPGARLATFTAAGQVRRGLEAQGFAVETVPGFGRKRDCLRARFSGEPGPGPTPPASVAVIGSGIAGSAVARVLDRRGLPVTLVDASTAPGGPPAAVFHARPTGGAVDHVLHLQAYLHALRLYDDLEAWSGPRGVLALGRDEDDGERYRRWFDASGLPADHAVWTETEGENPAGVSTPRSGIWFPQGGCVDPARLCAALSDGLARQSTHVRALEANGEGWRLEGEGGDVIGVVGAIVLASGAGTPNLRPGAGLPVQRNRGQMSFLDPSAPQLRDLQAVVSFGAYLTPALGPENCHILGATFERWAGETGEASELREEDHAANLATLTERWPAIAGDVTATGGWAGLRATTPDRFPLVGPVPGEETGLYVASGFGSRGFLTAPLAAELLAARMLGEPLPVGADAADALDPGRFRAREARRAGTS